MTRDFGVSQNRGRGAKHGGTSERTAGDFCSYDIRDRHFFGCRQAAAGAGEESLRWRCEDGEAWRIWISRELRVLPRAGRARWRARTGFDADTEKAWQKRRGTL